MLPKVNYKWPPHNKYLRYTGQIIDFIFFPFSFLIRKHKISKPQKILVFESQLIGDNIMTSSLLNCLKFNFQSSVLCTLSNFCGDQIIQDKIVSKKYLCDIPWIKHNYSFENIINFLKMISVLRKEKFDIAIETRGDWRNCIILFLIGAKVRVAPILAGGKIFVNYPIKDLDRYENLWKIRKRIAIEVCANINYFVPCIKESQESVSLVDDFLKSRNIHKFFIFNPFSSLEWRSLDLTLINKIINKLKEKKIQFIVPIEPSKKKKLGLDLLNEIVIFSYSLSDVFELMKRAEGCITVDTSLSHLAAVYNKPLLLMYNHDSIDSVAPQHEKVKSLCFTEIYKDTINFNEQLIDFTLIRN